MKFSICAFAVLIAAASGVRFEVKSEGKVCVLLDVEAVFTLEAIDNGTLIKKFDLTGINPDSASGLCNASLTIPFNATGLEKWTLIFIPNRGLVTLQQLFSFTPSLYFNQSSLHNETVSLTGPSTDLSSNTTSYRCEAESRFKLTSDNYTLTLILSKLQVQAFNVVNGNYSEAEECTADATSSTQALTTDVTTAVTTEIRTSVASTVETTPSPQTGTYAVKDHNNVTCILLEAQLKYRITYNTTNNENTVEVVVPVNATTTGICANGSKEGEAQLNITNGDDVLVITARRTETRSVSSIVLHVHLDGIRFPNASEANQTIQLVGIETIKQTDVATFYVCPKEDKIHFVNTTSLLLATNVKFQPFDLVNGSFSGQGESCEIVSTSTVSPTTTPKPAPSTPTYYVKEGNITCIVFQSIITLKNLTYTTGKKTINTTEVMIPSNASSSGKCNYARDSQLLNITFNGNWSLSLVFVNGSKDSAMLDASNDYYVNSISFIYYLDTTYFPDAETPGAKQTAEVSNMTGYLVGSTSGSYKCNAQIDQPISNGVVLETKNLQYRAFGTDNTTTFNSDNVSECPADEESNSVVPIAVGAALAGLVVIVLIAYLIGRRRSRRQGYESV